jgi:hypothetical protein
MVFLSGCTSESKKSLNLNLLKIEQDRVLRAADDHLGSEVVTVTDTVATRSAGGQHDYYSGGYYWWPDLDNPEEPYIRKDGQSNS